MALANSTNDFKVNEMNALNEYSYYIGLYMNVLIRLKIHFHQLVRLLCTTLKKSTLLK